MGGDDLPRGNHHKNSVWVQPLWQRYAKLGDIVPSAEAILSGKEEMRNLPQDKNQRGPPCSIDTVEGGWRQIDCVFIKSQLEKHSPQLMDWQ